MSAPQIHAPIEILESTPSTNTWLKNHLEGKPHGYAVSAIEQSAGRGQRGNSWEAEVGKNLTFSLLLRPEGVHASRQFMISEVVCVGVALVLRRYLRGIIEEEEVKVKWPNDIYVGDRKICGILIENSLTPGGNLSTCVAGMGVNVNQREFHSGAPNPVSMRQLTGSDTPLMPLLEEIRLEILRLLTQPDLHTLYRSMLYRGEGGLHPFFIPDPTLPVGIKAQKGAERFMAAIEDVEPDGTILLRHPDGGLSRHLFKELSFLIEEV